MPLKILHTADWHLGKKLYEYSLIEDHKLFFSELISIITANEVDYLLVSGDIFDQAHPSNESLELYYSFITQLIPTNCKLIVTGGNHDSPGVLNAPGSVLKMLNVSVVGAATSDPLQQLIPLYNKKDELSAVVAAVPYLRDRDIRISTEGSVSRQRIEDIKNGIKNHYKKLADLSAEHYPGIPAIAMGHLFCLNAEVSDSEREIQVGNLAGVEASAFPGIFKYVALGHIHKPQNVGSERICYSGSPIPLSFSEKNYEKRIVLLSIDGQQIQRENILLTIHRQLDQIEGSLQEVQAALSSFENKYLLPAILEVRINEKNYDPVVLRSRESLQEILDKKKNALIIQFRVNFTDQQQQSSLPETEEDLSDLQPLNLWKTLISEYPEMQRKELEDAFLEIVESSKSESE